MSSGAVPVFSTTLWNACGENFAPSVLRALSRSSSKRELADHVRARLPGHDDVALDLARLEAVVDRLLARPALGVQARVHDEPARAEQLRVEHAEHPFGIAVVPAVLRNQFFRVQRPAFGHRGNAAEHARLAELRQACVLLLERDLEVMTRHGLVIHQRAQRELRHALLAQRDLEYRGPRAVERCAVVIGGGAGFAEARERLRDHCRLRLQIEQRRAALERVRDESIRVFHDRRAARLRRRIGVAQVVAQLLDSLAHGALGAPQLLQDLVLLGFDLRDLLAGRSGESGPR